MTRKFSITLPDDLAELLDDQENASAFIADALRHHRQREDVRTFLARQGYRVTDEGVARMHTRLADKRRAIASKVAAGDL
jgi:Arc/MetJ-type ribon-helix-helix transcriptional regulator